MARDDDRTVHMSGPAASLGRIPDWRRRAAQRGIAAARKALERDNDTTEDGDGPTRDDD